jgi:hypothetical protein
LDESSATFPENFTAEVRRRASESPHARAHIFPNAYLLFKLHGKFGTSGPAKFMDGPHFAACHGRWSAAFVAVIGIYGRA